MESSFGKEELRRRERARTERRFARSTFSGTNSTRSLLGLPPVLAAGEFSRYSCNRRSVSLPFLLLRVVKITVRVLEAGFERRKSSARRQHIEKPRPLPWVEG